MEAKVLYCCMMDRHELSDKNGWHDRDGRIYIYYTFEQICEDMHVSRKKAAAMLDELENKAGLIERVRQGQGRPNRIYVHRFHQRSYPQAVSDGNFLKYPKETQSILIIIRLIRARSNQSIRWMRSRRCVLISIITVLSRN